MQQSAYHDDPSAKANPIIVPGDLHLQESKPSSVGQTS
jgi:hypothetical protein